MVSGMITSRTSFSFGSSLAWPFRRCMRRRNEATERSRTSSALSAVTSVRRPRGCFGRGRARVGLRRRPGARRAAGAAARRARRLVVFGLGCRASATRAAGAPRGGGVSRPRRSASWRPRSALRLASSSWRRRSSSSRLRASAASRSACSMRLAARRGGAPLPRRSCALRPRARAASASAWARALRSSSVSVRSTTPDGFGAGCGGAAGVGGLAAARGRALRRGAAAAAAGAAASGFASAPTIRRFYLLDHDRLGAAMAEALAHHARARRARFSVSVLSVPTLSVLSPGFFVSAHSVPSPVAASVSRRAIVAPARPVRRSESAQAPTARQEASRLRARQAGQHVSHLTGPMPNPIAPPVKAWMTGDFRPRRCAAAQRAGELARRRRRGRPAACSRPTTVSRPSAASTLAKPATTCPALRASDSASSAARSSSRSTWSRQVRRRPARRA